jgi:sodium bicarbonate transporter 10
MFTAIQLACLIALWLIKSFKKTSILFPLMVRKSIMTHVILSPRKFNCVSCFVQLVVMIGIRKLLDFLFTQRELKILDDVMPETSKRSAEEKKRKLAEQAEAESGEVRIKF